MGILETLMGKVSAPLQDRDKNPERISEVEQNIADVAEGIAAKGLNNESIAEPIPMYTPAGCERVIAAGTNSWIVLGRDRPSNMASGYGGSAATGAGSIDLVVGRQPLDPTLSVDPNFISDAARIHISQTTDVDKNFNLAAGSIGRVDARSAIGMKADEVRIVGRHAIKIITEGRGSINSKGGKQKTTAGIDLIAGNQDADLQPIPLGETLVACLSDLTDLMDDLAAIVAANSDGLKSIAIAFGTHMHGIPIPMPPFFIPLTPPPDPASMAVATMTTGKLFMNAIAPMYLHRTNVTTFRFNNFVPAGAQWICSRHNHTN
jgi:hypothetical protein